MIDVMLTLDHFRAHASRPLGRWIFDNEPEIKIILTRAREAARAHEATAGTHWLVSGVKQGRNVDAGPPFANYDEAQEQAVHAQEIQGWKSVRIDKVSITPPTAKKAKTKGETPSAATGFLAIYTEELAKEVERHPEDYRYSGALNVAQVAEKMARAVGEAASGYAKDSAAWARTAKRLGIPNTYAGFNGYAKAHPEEFINPEFYIAEQDGWFNVQAPGGASDRRRTLPEAIVRLREIYKLTPETPVYQWKDGAFHVVERYDWRPAGRAFVDAQRGELYRARKATKKDATPHDYELSATLDVMHEILNERPTAEQEERFKSLKLHFIDLTAPPGRKVKR